MGESRTVDDMVCGLWRAIEGGHCYSYLKPPLADVVVARSVAWRPYLGTEIALPQARGLFTEYRPTLYDAFSSSPRSEQAPSHPKQHEQPLNRTCTERTLSLEDVIDHTQISPSEYPVSPEPSPFPVAPPRPSAETPTLVALPVDLHNPRHGPSLVCHCSA